jgi:hypothetical protein
MVYERARAIGVEGSSRPVRRGEVGGTGVVPASAVRSCRDAQRTGIKMIPVRRGGGGSGVGSQEIDE